MDIDAIIGIFGSAIRQATPLIFAGMGGLIAERSGTVDIGLEGKMLMAAFVGACTASLTGSLPLAVILAIAASLLMSMIHGYATITQKGDHVISGFALNLLASGITLVVGQAFFHEGGQTPALDSDLRFKPLHLPGTEALQDIPLLGSVYANIFSGHHLLIYIALASVFFTSFLLNKTRFGLRLRAVGDEPNAVDTAGLSVSKLRYTALAITGLMCGLAGVTLSMAQNAGFVKEMSAGMGYMALAAVIFGKWRPWPTFWACLLFGFLRALADKMQGQEIMGVMVPSQLFEALPYIMTIVLLAGFVGKSVAPKAIGRPYLKER